MCLDGPVTEDDQHVGRSKCTWLMSDDQDGFSALLQLGQRSQKRIFALAVEIGVRLIENDEHRIKP